MMMPFQVYTEEANPTTDSALAVGNDKHSPVLKNQMSELRQLLVSIDQLNANLLKIAEKALSNADAAPDLVMRRRYEQLYAQTSARISELQKSRAEIARFLSTMEAQPEIQPHGR